MMTETTRPATLCWFFEIYVDNGEDILVGHVLNAKDRDDAKATIALRYGRRSMEVIQLYETYLSPLAVDEGDHHILHAR